MKVARNVMLDSKAYSEARERGFNISKICSEALVVALSQNIQPEQEDVFIRLSVLEKTFIKLAKPEMFFTALSPFSETNMEQRFYFKDGQRGALMKVLSFKGLSVSPFSLPKILEKINKEVR